MRDRVATVATVFRSAFRNPTLRRVGFAYAMFSTSEFGTWIVLLVYAFAHGGIGTELVITLVQLMPCVVFAPVFASVAGRWRASRTLTAGYAIQALTVGAVAVAVTSGAPVWVVFVLAPLTALAFTITRPAQSAVLPAVVRTADELTAANVMTGWTEEGAALVGPGIAGLLMAWHGPGLALAAMAACSLASFTLVVGVIGPTGAPRRSAAGPEPSGRTTGDGATNPGGGLWDDIRGNLSSTVFDPDLRILLVLSTFFFVLIGALDYLCVVLALDLLHMGQGGAGYLNAALGLGGLAAGFVTAFLVGRRHLARTLTFSLLASVAALALVAVYPHVAFTLGLLVVVGLSAGVFNATSKTFMQRIAPPDSIAGAFSILEALLNLGLALGAILIWAVTAAAGVRVALIAPGVVALVLLATVWRRLRAVDSAVVIPQVEIHLLRSIPLFAALPAPTIETVARALEPLPLAAGTSVVTEGEPGDRYYVVADGGLDVTREGRHLAHIGRGHAFGEIALIRDCPRTASVVTTADTLLYGLDGELFVETVTGNPSAMRVVGEVVEGHLGVDNDRSGD